MSCTQIASMRQLVCILVALLCFGGCKSKESKSEIDGKVPAFLEANHDIDQELIEESQQEVDDEDMPGAKRKRREGGDYVAAEFKDGAARWRDCGVYVDGKPVGVMNFGERPVTLNPVWVEDKASAPKHYGTDEPGWKIVKQRHYRVTEYLAALGVDLAKIKEIHIYGPNPLNVIVASGDELREKAAAVLFHFGGEVDGKALPVVPEGFGNGKSPDKIGGICVYIEKKPPTLVRNEGMELDGKMIKGVPYYGEPMRGGVRIYLDDRLTAVSKRRLLEDTKGISVQKEDGTVAWDLFAFLKSQGVDTAKIAEAWVIRDERRKEKLSREELEHITFEVDAAASGEIKLGKNQIPTPILALHTKPVTEAQLPHILPDEQL